MIPAFSACTESPEPGMSTSSTVSAMPITSTSLWPVPTVSRKTTSLPAASSMSSACSVASASPPRWPRVPIERMKTPGSRKWSERRMRSPSSAPCENGLDGSTETTPTVVLCRAHVPDERGDEARLADAGRPRQPDRVRPSRSRDRGRATTSYASGSPFSTSVIARASARRSPLRTPAARVSRVQSRRPATRRSSWQTLRPARARRPPARARACSRRPRRGRRIPAPIAHTQRASPGDISAPARTIATPMPGQVALITNVSARPRIVVPRALDEQRVADDRDAVADAADDAAHGRHPDVDARGADAEADRHHDERSRRTCARRRGARRRSCSRSCRSRGRRRSRRTAGRSRSRRRRACSSP